jgi:hypothetical protein
MITHYSRFLVLAAVAVLVLSTPGSASAGRADKYIGKVVFSDNRIDPDFFHRATLLKELPPGSRLSALAILRPPDEKIKKVTAEIFGDGQLLYRGDWELFRGENRKFVTFDFIKADPDPDYEKIISLLGDGQPHKLRVIVSVSGKELAAGECSYGVGEPIDPNSQPEFRYSASAMEKTIASKIKKHRARPQGAAMDGLLEKFKPFNLKVKRGRCYLAAIRLKAGASFSSHAKKGGVDLITIKPDSTNQSSFVHGPGGIGSMGCPQTSGAWKLDIQAIWGRAQDSSKIHDLGNGPFSLRVYSYPISKKKLRAEAAGDKRQEKEYRQWKRKHHRKICSDCAGMRHNKQKYHTCLERSGLTENDCR